MAGLPGFNAAGLATPSPVPGPAMTPQSLGLAANKALGLNRTQHMASPMASEITGPVPSNTMANPHGGFYTPGLGGTSVSSSLVKSQDPALYYGSNPNAAGGDPFAASRAMAASQPPAWEGGFGAGGYKSTLSQLGTPIGSPKWNSAEAKMSASSRAAWNLPGGSGPIQATGMPGIIRQGNSFSDGTAPSVNPYPASAGWTKVPGANGTTMEQGPLSAGYGPQDPSVLANNMTTGQGAAEQLATNLHNQGATLSPAQQNAIFGGTGASYDKPVPGLKPFSDPGSVSSYQKMIGPRPAGLPSASGMPQRANPMKSPLVDSFFTGRAPYLGVPNISAAIPSPGQVTAAKPKPAAQQVGNFIGSSIGDAWGAGPGVPTAPDAPTFTPSKWAGTHAVEAAYNSGLGRFTTSGIGDYWGAGKGMPKAPKVPAIYDPAEWWISKQLGSFGRGLAGS